MRYIAHRGMNRRALENTLPAFELAFEAADGIELDVQLAADGTPVVFHDDTLERIFGRPGSIEDYTAEELAGFAPSPREDYPVPYEGWVPSAEERIPTLAAVLERVPDGFFVNIELKAPHVRWKAVAPPVAEMLAERRGVYLVSSFNPLELVRFARHHRSTPLALLYTPESNLVLRNGWPAAVLGITGLAAVHPNWKLVSPDLIERAHARGWSVNVWTVNDPDRAAWLAQEGIDGVISDQPDRLVPAESSSTES